jgi:hypothetical protein
MCRRDGFPSRLVRQQEKETDIQRSILDYLKLKGYRCCWRQNNTAISYVDAHGARRFRAMPAYARRGLPDILLVHPKDGRLYGIEVKTNAGRQSEDQKAFERDMTAANGVYILARSVDDVIAARL